MNYTDPTGNSSESEYAAAYAAAQGASSADLTRIQQGFEATTGSSSTTTTSCLPTPVTSADGYTTSMINSSTTVTTMTMGFADGSTTTRTTTTTHTTIESHTKYDGYESINTYDILISDTATTTTGPTGGNNTSPPVIAGTTNGNPSGGGGGSDITVNSILQGIHNNTQGAIRDGLNFQNNANGNIGLYLWGTVMVAVNSVADFVVPENNDEAALMMMCGAGFFGKVERTITNPKIYAGLEKQFSKFGNANIVKTLDSAREALRTHISKLNSLQYKSQVEKTIRNVSDQIDTILKFMEDKGL
jgi:hypothetical protein